MTPTHLYVAYDHTSKTPCPNQQKKKNVKKIQTTKKQNQLYKKSYQTKNVSTIFFCLLHIHKTPRHETPKTKKQKKLKLTSQGKKISFDFFFFLQFHKIHKKIKIYNNRIKKKKSKSRPVSYI